jgi:glycosyltransferase involved in cell wall biosynthesis
LADREGRITVTGYVDDLRPYLQTALVAVCPMRIGVGIQNKALEAMAVGRPVVCSPLVSRALAGAAPGGDGGLRVANTADEFARSCAQLLSQPEEAHRAGAAARRYVEKHHRWSCAAEALVELYNEVRAEAKGQTPR